MPLTDYYPNTNKSDDLYERLGLRSRDVIPDVVFAAYQQRMEWWHSMMANAKWAPEVAGAKNRLQEARDTLSHPSRKREWDAAHPPIGEGFGKHNILLLGGPGAGKSALLGAVYDVARERDTPLAPLDVRFSTKSRPNILTNLQKLKSFCAPQFGRGSKMLAREANIPDTYTPYGMIVALRGKDRLELTFIDTAGEDLARAIDEKSSLIDNMRKCHAAILVVDTLALEHQDRLTQNCGLDTNARRNMPENVEVAVQEWLRDEPDAPRLFCIVPIKVETKTYDARTGREKPGARTEIIQQTLRMFENTISYLEQQGNCVVVITPIETCGCLTLSPEWNDSLANSPTYPAELWDFIVDRERSPEYKRYTPSGCELPLTFILNFFLTLAEAAADASSGGKVTRGTLVIPSSVIDVLTRFLPKHVVEQVVEVADRFTYAVGFITQLLGWARYDVRQAIRQVMKQSLRYDGSVQIYGNRDLLTLTD